MAVRQQKEQKRLRAQLLRDPYGDVTEHLQANLLCDPVTLLPRDTSADPAHLGPPGARRHDQVWEEEWLAKYNTFRFYPQPLNAIQKG